MTNLETFLTIYQEKLQDAVIQHPTEYAYAVSMVPLVVERMSKAIVNGTYHLSGPALKATCKALGIKMTYKAINTYLGVV